jgi:cell division protein FtsQ
MATGRPRRPKVPQRPRPGGEGLAAPASAAPEQSAPTPERLEQPAPAPAPAPAPVSAPVSARVLYLGPVPDATADSGHEGTPGQVPARVGQDSARPAPLAVTVAEEEDAAGGPTVIAFPEPPRVRRRRRALIGAAVAVAAASGLLAVLLFSPALALRTVTVEGNKLVPAAEVAAALKPLKGESLARITDGRVEALLSGQPAIEQVTVAAEPPSTLVVSIQERVPVAVLRKGKRFALIDSEGRQLAAVGKRTDAKLPLISGGSAAVRDDLFPAISAVLSALPPGVLSRLDHASADSLDSVELTLKNGKTIFWGSAEESAFKARVVTALLKAPKTVPPVTVYDVSAPARPVTR